MILTLVVIKVSWFYPSTIDSQLGEPQKHHNKLVPRIGGLAVCCAVVLPLCILFLLDSAVFSPIAKLWLCALPAFLIGFIEDITKSIRPSMRFIFCCVSGLLAYYFCGAQIARLEIPLLDGLLQFAPVAIIFTVFAVAGLCNAINIIDGFNGLAGFVSAMMFLSLAYVAHSVGDPLILSVSLVMAGAILGFLIWNFPLGLIFLGDGGAYFIGFMLAEASILLTLRNPDVSVWYPVLLFSYPIFETIFSIYRKKFIRGMSPSVPDGIHLHMLVFRRVVRWAVGRKIAAHITLKNSATSPYLWILSGLAILPATLLWHYQLALISLSLLFCVTYVWLYLRIVRFNTPQWMLTFKR